MIKDYFLPKKYCEVFKNLKDEICGGVPTAVFGVTNSNRCQLLSYLDLPYLYIVRDEITAKSMAEELNSYDENGCVFLPSKDEVVLYKTSFNKEKLYSRLTALFEIQSGKCSVVTTFEALVQLFPKKIDYLTIEKDKEYDLYQIIDKLVAIGYKREDYVETKGSFSVRGDILEVFPINSENIYRVDFFGDQVENIRIFGESEELGSIDIVMASDVIIKEEEVSSIKTKLRTYVGAFGAKMNSHKAYGLYTKLVEKLESNLLDDSLEYLFPIIQNKTHDIFEYMPKSTLVVFDESKIIYDNLTNLYKEFGDRVSSLLRNGEGLDCIKDQYLDRESLLNLFKDKRNLALQSLTTQIPFFNPLKTVSLKSGVLSKYAFKPNDLCMDVTNWIGEGYKVILFAQNDKNAEEIYYTLRRGGIDPRITNNTSDVGRVFITSYYLPTGYVSHDNKLVFVGTNDLFLKAKSKEKKLKGKRNYLFTAPEVGDFAVHETFGIGVVRGVKRLSFIEGEKDYVELEYAGGDRVYVATDQMDKLSKYVGGDNVPTLSKIGNGEFERVKQRVKASIAKMTINLKKLYKERREKVGFTFLPENEISEEFYDSFEFDETEDQLTSWEEIRQDMESKKVMDRLLCGDVGFGKTEVAFRACLKAVISGKQAAIVAPTTILSEQHYMSAKERFKDFGVRIEVLNRFRTPAQQTHILYMVKNGDVDILIGTHRLLSKDVEFKDLGLLIVDEEQRFGVEQKEKIKDKYKNIDTLSLSATPIPRTLHMSLTGIRDISTINTPPKERIPVQVVVTELTENVIRDAVNKEIARNGQVFILYNRVDTIYSFADKVQGLVPNAKIIVAHGQLSERTLEDKIVAFYKGEADILIATTIIENGIDIPRANTLIVCDSDHLGLSTLYQLKGRVGRSSLMAYAYFTYAENKVLTNDAFKRLTALTEYSEMGSGYKIAMKDLEIRGAGNILGSEQHGHMDRVGYELYNKLLKEELGEVTKMQEVELEIKVDAYIPEKYIQSEKGRMDCYKQIAEISSIQDEERVIGDIKDTYGEIPKEVLELVKIAKLKYLSSIMGAIKVKVSQNVARIYLKDLDDLKDGIIVKIIKERLNNVSLTFEEVPIIVFTIEGGKPEDEIEYMIEFTSKVNEERKEM